MGFLVASCLAVAALAAPEADADAYYGSLAATWPAAYGWGVQSTCYGCRGHYIGKRSAEADPYYGYGYAAPVYGYGHGIAHHGGHATSFVARSPQGLHGHYGHYIGKRSAEADAYYGYGYAAPVYGYGHGLALHGGHATSFVARSPQGLHGHYGHYIGKRSAEAD